MSIKNSECQQKGTENSDIHIAGPDLKPRQTDAQLTRNGNFKDAFARFIMVKWRTDHYFSILDQKETFLPHGGHCIQLRAGVNEYVTVFEPMHLQGKHEEADTLTGMHMVNIDGNIMIHSSDTDVLVIIIGLLGKPGYADAISSQVIMDCGAGNNRRYINVSEIVKNLEEKTPGLVESLPGFHSFTGCDYMSAFYKKRKNHAICNS